MKRLAYCLAPFSITVLLLLAPCASAQSTHTAASCNSSDVNAVINGPTHTAVDGDIIQIPAGTCEWSKGITVPTGIGITIIGSGTPNTAPSSMGASPSCSDTVILSAGGDFSMTPTYGNSLSRISCMKLAVTGTATTSPVSVYGTCTSSGCPNFRLDNITAPSAWANGSISDSTFAAVGDVFGVADHNTIGDVPSISNGVDFVNVSHGNWMGVGSWGDNSWASPDSFGTAQQFYLENNVFNYAFGTDADRYGPGSGGGRYTCRFNTFNYPGGATACTDHGTDTIGRTRGGRQLELYRNTITCGTTSALCAGVFNFRSGVGLIWGNSMTGWANAYVTLDSQRAWRADPWGGCNGTSAWDTNDGTTYHSGTVSSFTGLGTGVWTITDAASPGWATNEWAANGDPSAFYDVTRNYGIMLASNTSNAMSTVFLCDSCISFRPIPGDSYKILRATVCLDQPTRSGGNLIKGGDGTVATEGSMTPVLASTGAPGAVNENLDPTYEFADSGAPGHSEVSAAELTMIANRDFYAQNVGQTAQTSPSSPFNGASGTGYGTLANRPPTCKPYVGYWATDQGSWNQSGIGEQGEFFVCTATNTWTLYYTPYTYPHPLVAGGASSGNSPNPPTGLTATVQ